MAAIQLTITGMTCDHCRKRVEEALKGVSGVYGVFVDLNAGTAEVDCDNSSTTDALIAAVKSAGYDAAAAE